MYQDISEVLLKCQSYANCGYSMAMSGYEKIHATLKEERSKLKEADNEQHNFDRIADIVTLQKQKKALDDARELEEKLKHDLMLLKKRTKEFSVVVFGRTMAGKSTLMEILTHGNGTSIGKGSQRTTLDVRDYHWQGMKITDVPGIASFDGEEDDRLAMEAAKSADLILFLITDDAPQKEEAQRLYELRAMGKPVLGIVNVKKAIRFEMRKLALKQLTSNLSDTDRLDTICNQFKAYAEQFNQDWEEIPFIYTHLKAAYLGQDGKDTEFYELSHFSQVEDYILDKVRQDGCFLRIKTFIDAAVVPMEQIALQVLDNSHYNGVEGLAYRRKWHGLDDWKNEFVEKGREKFDNFMSRLRNEMDEFIIDFADKHYEDRNAGDNWNEEVRKLGLERKCFGFLRELSLECARKRRELTDDLRTEISYSSIKFNADDISMDDINDTQTWGNLAAIGAGLIFGGPIGIGIGILNWLLGDSKSEKIRKAKKELEGKLHEVMDPYLDNLSNYMINEINNNIIENGIGGLSNDLVSMDEMLLKLADDEQKVAGSLMLETMSLNNALWNAAGEYINGNAQNAVYDIPELENINIIRLPGKRIIAFGEGALNEACINKMEKLLAEDIEYIAVEDEEQFDERFAYVVGLYGDWTCNNIEYSDDDSIGLLYFNREGIVHENIRDDAEYRIVQQMLCAPLYD